MIRFDLTIELDYTVVQPADFVFNIHPVDTQQQRVTWEALKLSPDLEYRLETDSLYGNRHLRLCAPVGPLHLKYDAIVDVEHFFEVPGNIPEVPIRELPADILQFVYPSRYCQSDRLMAVAHQEFAAMEPGYQRVQAIRDWVFARTRFQAGTTHSKTSAMDTYRDQVGVCRDFAHLMIAVCRGLNIPARFVTSIDYGADAALGPTDFHAYVEVYLGERWYIFDPTGISPRMGLLRIATGRDASDVAFATIFGSVISAIPKIRIEAEDDELAGLVAPVRQDYALSTSPGQVDAPVLDVRALPPSVFAGQPAAVRTPANA